GGLRRLREPEADHTPLRQRESSGRLTSPSNDGRRRRRQSGYAPPKWRNWHKPPGWPVNSGSESLPTALFLVRAHPRLTKCQGPGGGRWPGLRGDAYEPDQG